MEASSETLSVTEIATPGVAAAVALEAVVTCLEDRKAEDIVAIDLSGKSSIADHMVIASGRSARQVAALADYAIEALKELGLKGLSVQGQDQADWVLIDAGDVIVHLFRPEVRDFYGLDKMWGADLDLEADDGSGTSAEAAAVTNGDYLN